MSLSNFGKNAAVHDNLVGVKSRDAFVRIVNEMIEQVTFNTSKMIKNQTTYHFVNEKIIILKSISL